MMPSYPRNLPKFAFPVSSLAVNRKNSIAKLMNTNCSARLDFSVPKNIAKVNIPHMKKYAAIADWSFAPLIVNDGNSFGSRIRPTNDHQNSPYELKATMPKVLPFLNSIEPTITCANPP